jgi:hypothetical protein
MLARAEVWNTDRTACSEAIILLATHCSNELREAIMMNSKVLSLRMTQSFGTAETMKRWLEMVPLTLEAINLSDLLFRFPSARSSPSAFRQPSQNKPSQRFIPWHKLGARA